MEIFEFFIRHLAASFSVRAKTDMAAIYGAHFNNQNAYGFRTPH